MPMYRSEKPARQAKGALWASAVVIGIAGATPCSAHSKEAMVKEKVIFERVLSHLSSVRSFISQKDLEHILNRPVENGPSDDSGKTYYVESSPSFPYLINLTNFSSNFRQVTTELYGASSSLLDIQFSPGPLKERKFNKDCLLAGDAIQILKANGWKVQQLKIWSQYFRWATFDQFQLPGKAILRLFHYVEYHVDESAKAQIYSKTEFIDADNFSCVDKMVVSSK